MCEQRSSCVKKRQPLLKKVIFILLSAQFTRVLCVACETNLKAQQSAIFLPLRSLPSRDLDVAAVSGRRTFASVQQTAWPVPVGSLPPLLKALPLALLGEVAGENCCRRNRRLWAVLTVLNKFTLHHAHGPGMSLFQW